MSRSPSPSPSRRPQRQRRSEQQQQRQQREFQRIVRAQQRGGGGVLRAALVISAFVAICVVATDAAARGRAAFISACFTAIESGRYWQTGRGAFSTPDQFFANVLYCSVVLDAWQRSAAVEPWLRVALGPATIWLLEIVENYALLLSFGRNTAWCYTGYPYGYFHGAIELSMCHIWWGIALTLEVAYADAVEPAGDALAPWIDPLLCALAVLVLAVGSSSSAATMMPRYPPPLACAFKPL